MKNNNLKVKYYNKYIIIRYSYKKIIVKNMFQFLTKILTNFYFFVSIELKKNFFVIQVKFYLKLAFNPSKYCISL